MIQKCSVFVGLLDADDISQILYEVYNYLDFPEFDDLCYDLHSMFDAMHHYGLDYGTERSWKLITEDLLKEFPDGYTTSEENVNKLINLIISKA